MSDLCNIARHLPAMAARQPDHPAVKIPRGRTRNGEIDYLALNFRELDAEADAWAAHLAARGVVRGDRVLVMVRQGLPLIAAAFALFKLGAVPVIIDPGMGLKSFLSCVARTRPRVLLGIPLAQIVSRIFREPFRSVEIRVGVSGSTTARIGTVQGSRSKFKDAPSESGSSLQSPVSALRTPTTTHHALFSTHHAPRTTHSAPFELSPTRADELAAILFTSGSTGAPKGVCYEHGMFEAQVSLVRATYHIEPGEIDLPMLPIFALFNPALGMTTIVPELDPRRPAAVDPRKIVQAIQQEKVTNSFGSPTLWRKISGYCLENKIQLGSLRRVLMAGAPVPPALFAAMKSIMPNGEAHSPYGATEALPVTTVSATEILTPSGPGAPSPAEAARRGAGTCIGRPIPGVELKIIAAVEGPIANINDARELPIGQIGEIIVRGDAVTKAYDNLPEATALAKIQGSESAAASGGSVWHRMGDVGYLDEAGRFWFCGRKAERIETEDGWFYTEQCEPIFAVHPKVRRCAVIGVTVRGKRRAALVVEPRPPSSAERRSLARELRAIGERNPVTADINLFNFYDTFPVDVRHNAKIHRLALARLLADKPCLELDKR